jgi:hypothetical protein
LINFARILSKQNKWDVDVVQAGVVVDVVKKVVVLQLVVTG